MFNLAQTLKLLSNGIIVDQTVQEKNFCRHRDANPRPLVWEPNTLFTVPSSQYTINFSKIKYLYTINYDVDKDEYDIHTFFCRFKKNIRNSSLNLSLVSGQNHI